MIPTVAVRIEDGAEAPPPSLKEGVFCWIPSVVAVPILANWVVHQEHLDGRYEVLRHQAPANFIEAAFARQRPKAKGQGAPEQCGEVEQLGWCPWSDSQHGSQRAPRKQNREVGEEELRQQHSVVGKIPRMGLGRKILSCAIYIAF